MKIKNLTPEEISKLKRYSINYYTDDDGYYNPYMEKDPDGDYFLVSDFIERVNH